MKKIILKILKIVFLCLFLSPVFIYIFIVIANNCIAWNIKNDLKSIKLPQQTEFVEGISVAGKISGNGNGMQYYGAILVTSDLTEDELEKYYQSVNKDIEMRIQEDEKVFGDMGYTFDKFDFKKSNYKISVWEYNDTYGEDAVFINELLDFDLRGH